MLNTALPCPRPSCPDLLLPLEPKQDRALAWERWAYTFAQLRQLAALAPHLPTEAPQLKAATYGMVLSSLLLHPSGGWQGGCRALLWPAAGGLERRAVVLQCPTWAACSASARSLSLPTRLPCLSAVCCRAAEHAVLLDCVQRWPQALYDAPQLQAAVLR